MGEVDTLARENASKLFCIVFILVISISSIIMLLVKTCGQRHALYNVRRCMILVLTMGSLLYALFTLVIYAQSLFGEDNDYTVPCRNAVTSYVYGYFYFPFVYGVGLMTLAVELFIGRATSSLQSVVVRLAFVSVPWLLGLVVVLPLTLNGTEWDMECMQDFSQSRMKSMYWVSIILPAVGVLVSAVVVHCVMTSRGPVAVNNTQVGAVQNQAFYRNTSAGGVVIKPSPEQLQQETCVQTQSQTMSMPFPQQNPSEGQNPPPYNSPYPQPAPSTAAPPGNQQQYPPSYNFPPQSYNTPPAAGGNPVPVTFVQTVPYQPQVPTVIQAANPLVRDHRGESRALLVASIVYFIFSLPWPVFILGYVFDDDAKRMEPVSEAAVYDTLFWVNSLRWELLLIVWFVLLR